MVNSARGKAQTYGLCLYSSNRISRAALDMRRAGVCAVELVGVLPPACGTPSGDTTDGCRFATAALACAVDSGDGRRVR